MRADAGFGDRPPRFAGRSNVMRRTDRLALAAAFVCLLPASLARAQDEPAMGELDETIVITATRTVRPVDRVGSSVTVIDAEDIARHQDRFVVDALERVPGVTVRRQSNRPGSQTSIFIRGADSDQTLVLLDGVRLHDPSAPNREAILDHLGVVDIERIEVLAGPQSVLYGSDAIGGVINIITRRGEGPPTGTLRFDGGTYSTFDLSAGVRGGGERHHYALSLSRIDSDGFSARSTPGSDDDGYGRTSIFARLGVGDERLGVEGSFQWLDAEIDIDSGANTATSRTDSRQYALSVAPHVSLLDGRWEQTLTGSLHRAERRNRGQGFVLPSEFTGALYELDWQHVLRPAAWLTTVVGGEYQHESGEFDLSKVGFPRVEATADSGAVYLDQQLELGKYIDVTAGLRVELHDRFGSEQTGRVTAVVRLGQTGGALHGSLANGFKAPTLAQLFNDSFGSANRNLTPEESFGWDLGYRQRLGSRASFGVTWFGNEIDDLILAVFDPATGSFPNRNVENVRTRGWEIGFHAVLLEGCRRLGDLTTQVAYTLTDTKAQDAASFGVISGGRLLRRPRHEAFGDLTWSPHEKLELTVDVLYVGGRFDIDPILFSPFEARSYVKVDVSGRVQLLEQLELFARIENVGNEQYEDVAGFETSGRAFYGGFRLEL
jgi:vitamin B12 transporter